MRLLLVIVFCVLPAIAGDLTARFELALNRVLRGGPPRLDDEFLLADLVPTPTRRFTNYSGDLSGRYIEALAAVARHNEAAVPGLDRLVLKAMALQKPDGHFGGPVGQAKVTADDMALLWGNGRMLVGLLEYQGVTHRPDVLAAARKLGDFLVSQAPRFNSEQVRSEFNGEKFAAGYICWTQNVEGFAALYRVTQDGRYLALAREIAARTDRHPSQHSHGFLTSIRGVLELYRITNERRYLDQARAAWQGAIASGNLLVNGGLPELFAPENKRDEGCSEADWLRLTLELWQITRKPEFLKQAELTWFNEFSFNQFHTGDFGHHEFSAAGTKPPAARAWWCCTFHGLRAMAAVFSYVFHAEGSDVYYDLPLDGRAEARGFTIAALSTLERDASSRLAILRSDGRPRQLAVRIPDWASNVEISLRGAKLETTVRG
ncbi:MAG: glycoside hydrolase family 127 protein, partial [Acidobacteria bacterium]|nr:glycoside hydrolase family 127 protein [Acidobacteriota bacterium]